MKALSDVHNPRVREIDDLIARLPKVELHVHLEGTLEPEMAFELAGRNGIPMPYASAAEMRAALKFTSLQSFLDVYYAACAALVTRADFRDLTVAYLERAYADGVCHVEPFFDPQTHTERGVPIGVVIEGILDGLADGERRFGITSGLILSFLRHLPVSHPEQLVEVYTSEASGYPSSTSSYPCATSCELSAVPQRGQYGTLLCPR